MIHEENRTLLSVSTIQGRCCYGKEHSLQTKNRHANLAGDTVFPPISQVKRKVAGVYHKVPYIIMYINNINRSILNTTERIQTGKYDVARIQ